MLFFKWGFTMDILQKQKEFIEIFSGFDDSFDRMSYLISLSSELPKPEPGLICQENLVKGCLSEVWLKAGVHNGRTYVYAYTDILSLKGILYMLVELFNNREPEEVSHVSMDFLDDCGINVLVEEGRRTGLGNVIETIKKEI